MTPANNNQDNSQPSDIELLQSVLVRENSAWTQFLQRFRPLIYRCIAKVVMRHAPDLGSADMDEIYSDLLFNLLRSNMRKLRLFNPRRGTKLSSWIGMITINTTYDFLRNIGRRPYLDRIDGICETMQACDRNPLDTLLEKERWSHLNHILEGFSVKDRTFLSLYYADGLDADTVANEMSISLKTVYSKNHKIRASLRRTVNRSSSDSPIADLSPVAA